MTKSTSWLELFDKLLDRLFDATPPREPVRLCRECFEGAKLGWHALYHHHYTRDGVCALCNKPTAVDNSVAVEWRDP